MFYLVIINGLIDALNPCAIGVLIFYLGLLLSLKTERKLLIAFGLFYILSIYVTYLFIGLGLLKSFHLFGVHNFFGWLSVILVLFLGLYNLKEYFLPNLYIPIISPFLSRCRIPRLNTKVGIISAIILGFLVGLCEIPCSGAIYLATVALLAVKQTFLTGLVYLLIYNLMFISPLVFIFVFVGNLKFYHWLQNTQSKTTKIVKLIMGLAMISSSILLFIWLMSSIK